jgi:hypothetical protein
MPKSGFYILPYQPFVRCAPCLAQETGHPLTVPNSADPTEQPVPPAPQYARAPVHPWLRRVHQIIGIEVFQDHHQFVSFVFADVGSYNCPEILDLPKMFRRIIVVQTRVYVRLDIPT